MLSPPRNAKGEGHCALADGPTDSFSAPDADYVSIARLLVDAGATIEFKDVEMATSPLSGWLADALKDQQGSS